MNTTSSSSFGKISALLLSAALSVFCAYAQEEPGAAADADIPALARDETAENALFDTSAQFSKPAPTRRISWPISSPGGAGTTG